MDAIAQALNCSRRHLYNAFSDEPEGVAGYLLAQRLAACRRSLGDPAQQRRSIAEIALGNGFSSVAHFGRVFREHTGQTPGDYRRAAFP